MLIIKEAKVVDCVRHFRVFEYADGRGGLSFDCDESGRVLNPSHVGYQACLNGFIEGRRVVDQGVDTREWSYREPAIGRCFCGREVELDGFTNTCECGTDYNWAGQQLASREQWGEETGESLSDILAIP